MLSGGFLAIIKTVGGKMIYVDYCRGEIGNLPMLLYISDLVPAYLFLTILILSLVDLTVKL